MRVPREALAAKGVCEPATGYPPGVPLSPLVRRPRARAWAALSLVGALSLSGCASNSPEADGLELDAPSASSTAEQPSDVEVERDVAATLKRYYKAVIAVNRTLGRGDALDDLTTARWRNELVGNYEKNFFSEGQQLVGRWRVDVDTIEADDDQATATVCVDGTEVYVVDVGERVGSGSTGQDRTVSTITLRRSGEQWKVDATERGDEAC